MELCMLVDKGEEECKGKKEFKVNTIGSCFLEAITFFYIINVIYDYILYKKNIALNMFHVTCF